MQDRSLFLAAAATGLAVAATASVGYTLYSQRAYRKRREQLGRDVANVISHPTTPSASSPSEEATLPRQFDDSLVREFLARNYAFFGDKGMASVRGSTVVVVGCGGVGSWAALMLLRR